MENYMGGLTLLELWIVAIWGISIAVGWWRGVSREVLNILGWICAALGTLLAFPWISSLGRKFISPPLVADSILGGVVFLAILSVFTVTNHKLSKWIKGSSLSSLDRFLGSSFGAARGILGAGLIYSAAMAWLPQPTRQWLATESGPVLGMVLNSSQWLHRMLPIWDDICVHHGIKLGDQKVSNKPQSGKMNQSDKQLSVMLLPSKKSIHRLINSTMASTR